jgi:hypothetical protein
MTEYEHVTTNAAVETYESSSVYLEAFLRRSRSSPKRSRKPSAGKVKMINRVLEDLLTFLKEEPAGKYLDVLDDETLPQMSDAVLVMVQFGSALASFKERYYKSRGEFRGYAWITKEHLRRSGRRRRRGRWLTTCYDV